MGSSRCARSCRGRDVQLPHCPPCSARLNAAPATPYAGMLLATSGPYTPRMFLLAPAGGLIGRSRKCGISLLHDCEVSHNHAVIEPAQGGVLCIRDVGSTFGTYLNDKRLSEPKRASEPHKLKAYDSIKVGQTSLRWRPTELIGRAVAVAVPEASWLNQRLSKDLWKAIMPVDLPLLFRRVEQVRHVQARAPPNTALGSLRALSPRPPQCSVPAAAQVHTLSHGCTLRRSLGPIFSPAYRPGAEAIAAKTLAIIEQDVSLSASYFDTARRAVAAAGWSEEDSGLARMRELLTEAKAMRTESEQTHLDQVDRLEKLVWTLAEGLRTKDELEKVGDSR